MPVFLLFATVTLFPVFAFGARKQIEDCFEPVVLELGSTEVGVDVDGNVTDAEWEKAVRVHLKLAGKNNMSDDKRTPADATEVFLLRDQDNLFVGVRCFKKNMDEILAKHTTNSPGIFDDESIVVHLGIEDNYYRLVQFMVNAAGCYYVEDNYREIPQTTGLRVKTAAHENRWDVEMIIPISEVLVKPEQDAFKFNVSRTTYGKDGDVKEQSGWTAVERDDWYPRLPSANSVKHSNVLFLAGKDAERNKAAVERLKSNKLLSIGPDGGESNDISRREKWFRQVKPVLRFSPSLVYVEDVPGLPEVLIIGDSVSMGYTPFVRVRLANKANVHRIPGNGGPTERGLNGLERWIGGVKWEVICFNWGLHDTKYVGWDVNTGQKYSTPEKYGANLEVLVDRLRETGARLLWMNTTPVPDGAGGNLRGDELQFNKVADGIMRKNGIPVVDLYRHVLPHCDKYQRPKNIHFNHDGYEFLGKKVADAILEILNESKPKKTARKGKTR